MISCHHNRVHVVSYCLRNNTIIHRYWYVTLLDAVKLNVPLTAYSIALMGCIKQMRITATFCDSPSKASKRVRKAVELKKKEMHRSWESPQSWLSTTTTTKNVVFLWSNMLFVLILQQLTLLVSWFQTVYSIISKAELVHQNGTNTFIISLCHLFTEKYQCSFFTKIHQLRQCRWTLLHQTESNKSEL